MSQPRPERPPAGKSGAWASMGKRGGPPPPARHALPAQVEDLYSAAAAGGTKMTPDQIAEAQRMAREWKPTK